jgi:ribosomal-protein-serine acetyltransferase
VDRPTLRRLSAADADVFAAHIAGDLPRLSEFLGWPKITSTPAGAAAWLGVYDERRDGRVIALGAWNEHELLGGAVLLRHQPELAIVELGCWVVAGAEGRGVAAACCRELLAYARAELGAERIEWHAASANVRSRRLAERLGFRFEGSLRSSFALESARLDMDVLSLIGGEIDAAIAAP